MRLWPMILVAAAVAGCAPQIKLLTVTAADGAPQIRSDAGLKVTAEIQPIVNSQSPRLVLQRVSPAGPDVTRQLLQVGPANAAGVQTHRSVLAAGDAALLLPQGSRWNAVVTVPYTYGWTIETVAQSASFQVAEPAECFGFTTAPGSPRWTLKGYFKNDTSIVVAPISPEFYTDPNFPQPSDGDQSLGFRIGSIPTAHWVWDDMWSAEFISPALSGGNAYAPWAQTKAYTFQAFTEADNIQFQAIVTTLDNTGNIHTFRLQDDQHRALFWSVPNDGAWHAVNVDFSAVTGHVLTHSLRVFGKPADLEGNLGKRVVIDQLRRLP